MRCPFKGDCAGSNCVFYDAVYDCLFKKALQEGIKVNILYLPKNGF